MLFENKNYKIYVESRPNISRNPGIKPNYDSERDSKQRQREKDAIIRRKEREQECERKVEERRKMKEKERKDQERAKEKHAELDEKLALLIQARQRKEEAAQKLRRDPEQSQRQREKKARDKKRQEEEEKKNQERAIRRQARIDEKVKTEEEKRQKQIEAVQEAQIRRQQRQRTREEKRRKEEEMIKVKETEGKRTKYEADRLKIEAKLDFASTNRKNNVIFRDELEVQVNIPKRIGGKLEFNQIRDKPGAKVDRFFPVRGENIVVTIVGTPDQVSFVIKRILEKIAKELCDYRFMK